MNNSNCCDAAITEDGRCEACGEHANFVQAHEINYSNQHDLYVSRTTGKVITGPVLEVYDVKHLTVTEEFPNAYANCAGIVSKIMARRGQRNCFWHNWLSRDFSVQSTEGWMALP